MKKIIKIIVSVTLLIPVISCNDNHHADLIYVNGNVITINDAQPLASAIAVKDGLILAVGDDKAITDYEGPETKWVDLKGKTVVPGFVDAQSHFAGVGLQALLANLLPAPDGEVNDIAKLQSVMRHYITHSPIVKTYQVALGLNYDDSQLAGKHHPTRHDLDAISTDIPVIVVHQSGHVGVYNTKALAMMNITADTENPEGGVIERESDGRTPSGVLQENAHFKYFHQFIPKFTHQDRVKLFKAGEQRYIANGFTTIQDSKTGARALQALQAIADSVGFKVDIIAYPDIATIGDRAVFQDKGVSRDYINRFRIGGVKLTFDGSPQAKTAWFTEPYHRVPSGHGKDYSGYAALTDDKAREWMKEAYDNQWQLFVHANGDAAIDQLIRLVDELKPAIKTADHRTVMVHGQYTRKDQVSRLKALGISAALFPMHTFYWGDWHSSSVAGPDRAQHISPTGWFLDEQVSFTIHSDAPVIFPNAMRILDTAINRTTRSGKILGKEHRLTPLNALKAMTIWPAYHQFEEDRKGSIEVGKQADLVILDDNPLTIPQDKIKHIRILETINDGETIYSYL